MAVSDALRSLRLPGLPQRYAPETLLAQWRDALLACLPAGLRRLLAERSQRLVVAPRGEALRELARAGECRLAEKSASDGDGGLALPAPHELRGMRRAVVELPAEEVLRRTVSLPLQVRDNLRQVIGYEMDRLSPFQADEVYFDFRVRDHAPGGDKLNVELALCRRDHLSELLRCLREAGSPAEQVTWEGAWPKANLLAPEQRPKRGGGLLGLTPLLAVAVLALLVAVLVTPLWQKQRVLEERNAELADLRSRAEEVHELRTSLERAREGSVAVLQRKLETPRMIDLLRELTERLPDDTWVQNLDVRDDGVQIRGESAQATALIGVLEKAPGIDQVSFRSPVVQVATTGQERFHIAFDYVRPVPEQP